jgi:hypothetical protein
MDIVLTVVFLPNGSMVLAAIKPQIFGLVLQLLPSIPDAATL